LICIRQELPSPDDICAKILPFIIAFVSKPVALVTGGSRGIGRAIVEELSSTHQVIATYNNNRAAAEEVANGTDARILPCQLSSLESCSALVSEIGSVDLLINNAAMAPRERRDILEATPESFDELFATNLRGPYFLTQRLARRMLADGSRGRIVFIGSISSFTASVNRGDYCMTKAALSMAVKLFATRLAAEGIGVFEIEPGVIRTDMIASVAAAYEQRISEGLLPQRRMGEPRDVARAVRAIADGLLDYSTGQVLHVDGGFHLRIL
jgi:NAD(P)-dependent dehydrogenase (short-subunit alcohol dehydrogenase family)